MPLKIDRQAFWFRVAVACHVCEEVFAGCLVVLLCGEEGSERAVNLSGGFVNDGCRNAPDKGAEGGEEAMGFHG